MDDKVRVSICQAENGYVVTRSWQEKPKKGKDFGEYKEEPFVMTELPASIAKLFDKKGIKEVAKKGKKESWDEATKKAEKAFK